MLLELCHPAIEVGQRLLVATPCQRDLGRCLAQPGFRLRQRFCDLPLLLDSCPAFLIRRLGRNCHRLRGLRRAA
jgi:hypothetical protein